MGNEVSGGLLNLNSIGKKLFLGFSLVTLLVLISGFFGIKEVGRVAAMSDLIVTDFVPITDISMESIITINDFVGKLRHFLSSDDGLEELEEEIHELLSDLEMYLQMLKYGTENNEFKNSEAGKMYVKDKMTIQVKKSDEEMQIFISQINENLEEIKKEINDIIKIYKDSLSFKFDYEGNEYNLRSFFDAALLKHFDWKDSLIKCVDSTNQFTEQLDPTKCFFGKWYVDYKNDDKTLMENLNACQEEHIKIHTGGKKINDTQVIEERKNIYTGIVENFEAFRKQLNKTMNYSESRVKEFSEKNAKLEKMMFNTMEQIKENLEKMEADAGKEMEISVKQADDVQKGAKKLLIMIAIIALIASIIIGTSITKSITGPLSKCVDFANIISNYDLTKTLNVTSSDETGILSRTLSNMKDTLVAIVKDLGSNASTLSASSQELAATATELASNSEEMSSQTTNVASSTEQLTSNLTNVASSSEEMSSSIKTVAVAVEELNASLGEVSKNCMDASTIAQDANKQSQNASDIMRQLHDSSIEIGKVLDTINDIADQTNLLALNATIEAASAGDAGKGFAVVANEVKELAKQTAQATDDISRKVEGIQSNTENAVNAICAISKIIENINNITHTIASAVEEQLATTNEVARNIEGVSTASIEVSKNIGEASSGAEEISSNIQGINQGAASTASGATECSASAESLSKIAMDLNHIVEKFKV